MEKNLTKFISFPELRKRILLNLDLFLHSGRRDVGGEAHGSFFYCSLGQIKLLGPHIKDMMGL